MKFCVTKTDVVRSVKHLLQMLAEGSQLTITIEAEKSGGYYVSTATSFLWEDILREVVSAEQPTT